MENNATLVIRNMIYKGVQYKAPNEYLFLDQKRKMNVIQKIKKSIAKLEIKPEDLEFVTACLIRELQNVGQN